MPREESVALTKLEELDVQSNLDVTISNMAASYEAFVNDLRKQFVRSQVSRGADPDKFVEISRRRMDKQALRASVEDQFRSVD